MWNQTRDEFEERLKRKEVADQDKQWLEDWRYSNAKILDPYTKTAGYDPEQANEWDRLRFAMRERFGDEQLDGVTFRESKEKR